MKRNLATPSDQTNFQNENHFSLFQISPICNVSYADVARRILSRSPNPNLSPQGKNTESSDEHETNTPVASQSLEYFLFDDEEIQLNDNDCYSQGTVPDLPANQDENEIEIVQRPWVISFSSCALWAMDPIESFGRIVEVKLLHNSQLRVICDKQKTVLLDSSAFVRTIEQMDETTRSLIGPLVNTLVDTYHYTPLATWACILDSYAKKRNEEDSLELNPVLNISIASASEQIDRLEPEQCEEKKERKEKGKKRNKIGKFNMQLANLYAQRKECKFDEDYALVKRIPWNSLSPLAYKTQNDAFVCNMKFGDVVWPSWLRKENPDQHFCNPFKDPIIFSRLRMSKENEDILCTVYMKGCNDPNCAKSEKSNPCTFKMKFQWLANCKGGVLEIFAKGQHSPLFYPDFSRTSWDEATKKLVKAWSERKNPTEIQEMLIRRFSEAGVITETKGSILISKSQISNLKQNHKKSKYGTFQEELNVLKQYLVTSLPDGLKVVENVGNLQIYDIKEKSNFICIILNSKYIEECKEEILNGPVNVDGVFKTAEDRVLGKIATTGFLVCNKQRKSRLFAVAIYYTHISSTLLQILQALENELQVLLKIKQLQWRPTFLIDKEALEMKAIDEFGALWLLCRFHVMQAIYKTLSARSIEANHKAKILGLMMKMVASKSVELYLKFQGQLKDYCEQTTNMEGFYEYFLKNWDPIRLKWTAEGRAAMFGNWGTNNLLEYQFKSLQHWQDHVRQTNISHYVQDIVFWICQNEYNEKASTHLKRYTKIDKEQLQRYEEGRLLVDVVMRSSKASECPEFEHIFYVTSSKNDGIQYIVKLSDFQCTCASYYATCRPCKHIFACAYFVARQNRWIWLPQCPYSILHCTNLFIYEKEIFSKVQSAKSVGDIGFPITNPNPNQKERVGRPMKAKPKRGKKVVGAAQTIEPEVVQKTLDAKHSSKVVTIGAKDYDALEGPNYFVEDIVGLRWNERHLPQMLVKWQGYEEASWTIVQDSAQSCIQTFAEFIIRTMRIDGFQFQPSPTLISISKPNALAVYAVEKRDNKVFVTLNDRENGKEVVLGNRDTWSSLGQPIVDLVFFCRSFV